MGSKLSGPLYIFVAIISIIITVTLWVVHGDYVKIEKAGGAGGISTKQATDRKNLIFIMLMLSLIIAVISIYMSFVYILSPRTNVALDFTNLAAKQGQSFAPISAPAVIPTTGPPKMPNVA